MDSAFAGTVEQYNQLVNDELNTIQEALDGIADDCDDLDYDIAVSFIFPLVTCRVVYCQSTWD